jgi:hypothetical protein
LSGGVNLEVLQRRTTRTDSVHERFQRPGCGGRR